ncbi:hypothetical protein JOB18_033588 [Solea senegalensis]|uniref:Uncharacterized protein n=1 Tax=Solea senegalensis TaxID=28829 RepID=A0AAV6T910_SOLSE|nr:hypothetical protein JOB18_033588 [Solea senegalensis]
MSLVYLATVLLIASQSLPLYFSPVTVSDGVCASVMEEELKKSFSLTDSNESGTLKTTAFQVTSHFFVSRVKQSHRSFIPPYSDDSSHIEYWVLWVLFLGFLRDI